jgi:O-antigen ligase
VSEAALGAILLFGVLAFGSTERWARSALEGAIFLLGAAWAWRQMGRRGSEPFPGRAAPLALIVLLGVGQLAAGSTEFRFRTEEAAVAWGAWLIHFVNAAGVLSKPEAAFRLRVGMVWAGGAIAVEALLQHATAPGRIYWLFPTRSGINFGPLPNPDHYAALMELLMPAAIWQALEGGGSGAAGAVSAAAMFGSVAATGSRAGIVLGAAEIVLLPLMARRRFPGRRKAALVLAGFAAVAAAAAGWQLAWKRFRMEDPLRYRREIAGSALAMIRERPLAGFGLGTFETVYPAYASFDTGKRVSHAHNDWLEWTAEGGLPMLLLAAGFAGWNLWRNRANAWTWGAGVMLAHSLVDFPAQIPGLMALALALLAV